MSDGRSVARQVCGKQQTLALLDTCDRTIVAEFPDPSPLGFKDAPTMVRFAIDWVAQQQA